MHIIENDVLKIEVSNHGAEVQSIFHKGHQKEYLWQGDSKYWARRSPILFPIVGRLANNTYYHKGRDYHLMQHGFARDLDFEVVEKRNDYIKFMLKANEKTMSVYPFEFKLTISYKLIDNKLSVKYKVYNNNCDLMYFSIGAHPALNTNLSENGIEDYYLEFDENKSIKTKLLDKEVSLVSKNEKLIVDNSDKLDLKYSLFNDDALILEGIKSVTLKNKLNKEQIKMTFESFPLLGIWTTLKVPKCPFICLEPWHGMADYVGGPREIVDKAYIESLYPDDKFCALYTIEIN
jgi:galactose mutarotase-like enzyme